MLVKKMKSGIYFFFVILLVGCQGSPQTIPSIQLADISLNTNDIRIEACKSFLLTAATSPDNTLLISPLWGSSDDIIATVSNGLVTGIKAGWSEITVKVEGTSKPALCEVIVIPGVIHVTSISLNMASTAILENDKIQVVASVLPSNATEQSVTWNISNPTVAAVDGSGTVTGLKYGNAIITAAITEGSITASCSVTVNRLVAVNGITLIKKSATVQIGSSIQLCALISPTDATNQEVNWSSVSPGIATVSPAGLITGINTGSADIMATTLDGKKTAACTVVVTNPSGPVFNNLLIIYPNTNFRGAVSFSGSMNDSLKTTLINAFKNMPNLVADGTRNLAGFTYDIIEISTPVSSLTPIGEGYLYLSEDNIRSDLQIHAPPGKYDSVHVVWYNGTINSYFGHGGTFINNGTTTYSSIIAGSEWMWTGLGEMYGEIILHEWLHGVTYFYRSQGFVMPLPDDLHSAEHHGYMKSPTEGWMPWYRDYMQGKVWEPALNRYTGISNDAWLSGTPRLN